MMGYDLHRRDGDAYTGEEDYHANTSGWSYLLMLAEDGDWEPLGTTCFDESGVRDPRWEGGYHTNDQQYVTPEDARAIADAIDRVKGMRADYERYRDFIDGFVAYCRGGGFEIW